jgi:hypothetical protein
MSQKRPANSNMESAIEYAYIVSTVLVFSLSFIFIGAEAQGQGGALLTVATITAWAVCLTSWRWLHNRDIRI